MTSKLEILRSFRPELLKMRSDLEVMLLVLDRMCNFVDVLYDVELKHEFERETQKGKRPMFSRKE